MLKISYADCLSLSPAISSQFSVKCALHSLIAKNSLKLIFGGFKVVQGHRCW